jgi:hypothetical protein
MPPAFSTEPNPNEVSPVGTFVGMSTATIVSKHKQHNRMYYMKKKMRARSSSPAIMATMTTMMITVMTMRATTAEMMAMAATPIAPDPWSFTAKGTVQTLAAQRIYKSQTQLMWLSG